MIGANGGRVMSDAEESAPEVVDLKTPFILFAPVNAALVLALKQTEAPLWPLWPAYFTLVALWLTAILVQSPPAWRTWLIGTLRHSRFTQIYRSLTGRVLGAI